jgi:hypothetical protein
LVNFPELVEALKLTREGPELTFGTTAFVLSGDEVSDGASLIAPARGKWPMS